MRNVIKGFLCLFMQYAKGVESMSLKSKPCPKWGWHEKVHIKACHRCEAVTVPDKVKQDKNLHDYLVKGVWSQLDKHIEEFKQLTLPFNIKETECGRGSALEAKFVVHGKEEDEGVTLDICVKFEDCEDCKRCLDKRDNGHRFPDL